MTKTKLEYATILAELRKDGSDPKQLAKDLSLRKLLYEIELLENEAVAPPPPPPVKEKRGGPRSFWSWVTHNSSGEDEDTDEE